MSRHDFNPADLGIEVTPTGAKLGGALGSRSWWRPPPALVADLREMTSLPPQHPPPMPKLPAGQLRNDAEARAELQRQAPLAWRAVRHRVDLPAGKSTSRAKAWAAKTMRDVVGAVNVWAANLPDRTSLSLWAVAAIRWDGLEGYFGSRPRKPVAVLGRAVGLDIQRARAEQLVWEGWALPKTPAERKLVRLRLAALRELRAAQPETLAAARAMIEPHRARIDELVELAHQQRSIRRKGLNKAVAKGDWIWTLRTSRT